jgi:enamine deaminase RidA (YjgF/YER057c/UK114 family)
MRPAVAAVLLAALAGPSPAQGVEYLGADEFTGGSVGVVVGNGPLVHTTQFLPLQPDGTVLGKGNAGEQADAVLNLVGVAIETAKGDRDRVVRLNVGVADAAAVGLVRKVIEKWYPEGKRPAVTVVVGKLPHPDALVAMDGVAPAKDTATAVD